MPSVKDRIKNQQAQGLNAEELVEATKPVLVSVTTETAPVTVGEGWSKFIAPPAARGTSQLRRRVNVPVTSEVLAQLAHIDYEAFSQGSRWGLNRNLLIEAAITELGKHTDRWEKEYLTQRANGLDQSGVLQGRVTDEVERKMLMLRVGPTGRRTVGPLLGVVVAKLLTASSS